MSQAVDFDVAVVGLGAMGAATLCQLAARGVRAIGIDRYASPHEQGSSHGETRMTRQAVGEGEAYVPLVLKSHEIWRALEAASGETLLVACGGLIMAPGNGPTSHHGKPDFVQRSLATAQQFGIPHETPNAAAIRARYPHLRVPDDVRAYFEPGAGYLIPERCIAVQLQQAARHGAEIATGEPVLAVRQTGEHVEIVRPGGTLRVGRAVVAAGAWLGPLLGAPFDRLLEVKRQVLQWFRTEPDADFGKSPSVFIWMHGAGDADYFYGFPPSAEEGSIKVATEQYEDVTTAETVDRNVAPAEPARMFATHLRGRIANVRPELVRAKACLYTVTPDFGFIIDTPPGKDRVLAISACSGHGFKHSAGIGFAAAGWAVTGKSPIDLTPFGLARFGVR